MQALVASGHGAIVNISSTSALLASGGNYAYGPAKAAMIAWCRNRGLELVTAGGQTDPMRIAIDNLARTIQDPLLARVRSLLRKDYGFTRDAKKRFGVRAVYSSEPLRRPDNGAACDAAPTLSGLNCAGYGSSVCVTAPFGLFAASEALRHLATAAAPTRSAV